MRHALYLALGFGCLTAFTAAPAAFGQGTASARPISAERSLQVSPNGRYLTHADGRPFFYLADTAWELFHKLSRAEAEVYLRDRAAKGFTVIQAVVLAELDGLGTPNPGGHRPLIDNDPTRPNEAYFEDVDWVVNKAAELGLHIGLLPTWGDKWYNAPSDANPPIFTPENARVYGRFLGERYRSAPIIWILGGDRAIQNERHRAIVEAMAEGVEAGDGGRHLKTFHPTGQYSSAIWFHEAPWLDFNMIQTGHTRDRDNFNSIAAEYGRTPVKPVLDGEPGYENIPHAFDLKHGRLDAQAARKSLYWSLFSGACGHTYGCNEVWQMYRPGDRAMVWAYTVWREALDFPGAGQMRFGRELIESGPYFDRLPDPSLIEPPNTSGPSYIAACRGPDASYALIYVPTSQVFSVRTFLLLGPDLEVTWYDPRDGKRTRGDDVAVKMWTTTTFKPPAAGDWVLVLSRKKP